MGTEAGLGQLGSFPDWPMLGSFPDWDMRMAEATTAPIPLSSGRRISTEREPS